LDYKQVEIMTPKEFYESLQEKKPFTELTSTGISDNLTNVFEFAKMYAEAITVTRCCETLKDKETPTLKDAFIAGYKKRALMSGLKYDEVSELNAITNFKCWKSFDLNL